MALKVVFIDGAEHYERQDKKWKAITNGGDTASGVSGAHGRVNDDADWLKRKHTFAAATRGSFKQRFMFRNNASLDNDFIGAQGGLTNTHLQVCRNNDGTISVVGPSDSGWVHTTSATYALNTWFDIEFRCFISNGTGGYILKIDGEVPARAGGGLMYQSGGLDTQLGTDAFVAAFYAGNSNLNTYGDDAVIATGNTNLGTGEVETLYPTGPGAITELLRGGTDTLGNYSQCNEALYDSGGTYVYAGSEDIRDCYQFDSPSITGDNYVVQVCAVASHDGSGDPTFHFRLFLYVDGDVYNGDVIHDGALGYTSFFEVWNINPATRQPWAPEDFPIQAGVHCIDDGVRITQLVLEVAALTPTADPVDAGASRDYCGSVSEDVN